MIFNKKQNIQVKQNGYTLLFAVLTAALVLGVAVFILSVSRGQYLLASTARESTYAIYAADSGIECAALTALTLSTSTSGGTFKCSSMPIHTIGGLGSGQEIQFGTAPAGSGLLNALSVSFYADLGDNRCAEITFIKGMKSTDPSIPVTQIESRGYNYCIGNDTDAHPDTSNPKVVERAIRLTYVGM